MKKTKVRKDFILASINKILLFSTSLFILTLLNLSLVIDRCLAEVSYVPGSTQKICQLTGDFDKDINFNQPTINLTDTRYGVVGTDLGSSFKHDGKIYFLFGDTYPSTIIPRPEAADSVAYTEETYPNNCLDLTFNTGIDGKFDPPTVLFPGFDQGACSVPVEGLSYNGDMYVYFTTGNLCDNGLGECYLAKSLDDGHTFLLLYKLSVDYKFLNVQVEVVENSDNIQYNGIRQLLPANAQNEPVLFIWGSGVYRESDPYLAYIPLEDIENRSEIRYYTGTDGSGIPQWSTSESEAVPLFNHPCIGEFSASWNPFLKKWLMLYNCSYPRGTNFRVADYPWGPWSETQVLFDANEDNGYCYFIHEYDCPDAGSGCDQNYDCLQEDKDGNRCCRGGGGYGPYVISDFSEGVEGVYTTIYFTLSTWNPYQVMLMKSILTVDCSITVTSPTAGEDCLMYNTKTIRWTSSGAGNYVKIELGRPTGCGLGWSTIISSTSNDGSHNWTVPGPAQNNCKIRICSVDTPDCCGESPSFDMVLPTITVTSPSSGEDWEIDSSKTIRWSSLGVNGNVNIELGRPSGCGYSWSTITSSTSNDGSHNWTVQGPAQNNCKIRITSIAHTDVYGESRLFDIVGTATTSSTTSSTTTSTISSTYSISGRATCYGTPYVKIMFSNGSSTTTDEVGDYYKGGFTNGTYTVTPFSDFGCNFTPSSLTVTINNGNRTNINFTGYRPPNAPILDSPEDGYYDFDGDVTFYWHSGGDNGLVIDLYNFVIDIMDNGEWDNLATGYPTQTSVAMYDICGQQSCGYRWRVRAHSAAGWGEYSGYWEFTVVTDF